MAKYRYMSGEDLVTLDWLFNNGIVRVVRKFWNNFSKQQEIWMYEEFNISKRGYVSWRGGTKIQPDQYNEVIKLAKKNHVNMMGFS